MMHTRLKHNFTPDMLFQLESLEKKQIVNMRETEIKKFRLGTVSTKFKSFEYKEIK